MKYFFLMLKGAQGRYCLLSTNIVFIWRYNFR